MSSGGEFTFNFPKAYTSTPYCVMICPAQISSSTYYDLFVTLVSFTTTFTIHMGSDSSNNNGNMIFIAIAPIS
jgi:hypothetical protein